MKPEYVEMSARRIKADMGMLVEVTTTAQAPEWGE
jgi:hypothetical protein